MSTEYENHDDETILLAMRAVESTGLAYPSLPDVRNDFLSMMMHLRDDFRSGSLRTATGARLLSSNWMETAYYYLDGLRWADFTMWRYANESTPPKTRSGYAEADEVQDMMHRLLCLAYGEMAVAAFHTLKRWSDE